MSDRGYTSLRCAGIALAGLALLMAGAACRAAPEEIQVYMDDMSAPGTFGVDVHNNYVFSGQSVPEYQGEQPPAHVYRLTPEFYYGITSNLEAGLYVLSAVRPDNQVAVDGGKVRLKYIAPHDPTRGSFWGANLEVGRVDRQFAENPWAAELKGIYGYRTGRWTYAMNQNFDWDISGPAPSPLALDVDNKIAYRTDAGPQVGLESYDEIGPARQLGPLNEYSQTLFAALDTEVAGHDLNIGLGRGWSPSSDRWLLKFIVSFHL